MLHPWETLRIFLSGTFSDFHAERDYLVKRVMPKVRAWCLPYRLHVADIDLRWGVTEEAVEDDALIGLCLEGVDSAMPFFVCMLGERYGMLQMPPPELEAHPAVKPGRSVTHIEVAHALATAGEPFHCLFFERDAACMPAPEALRGFSPPERLAYRDAFCPRPGDPLQIALKESIRDHLASIGKGDHYSVYPCAFDPDLPNPENPRLRGRIASDSLREFGDMVYEGLIGAIASRYAARIADVRAFGGAAPEREYHESFAMQHLRAYVPRPKYIGALEAYATGDDRRPLLLTGASGDGKSSLLSHFSTLARDGLGGRFDLTIAHFAGASQQSTGVRPLLARVIDEAQRHYGAEAPVPYALDALAARFAELMRSEEVRLLLIVDGLDQMEGLYENPLWWLPAQTGEGVRVVVGVRTGVYPPDHACAQIALEPLEPDEIVSVVRELPNAFAKTLSERSIGLLREKPGAESPLYLKVALEELRMFGSHERLNEAIDALPRELEPMIIYTIDRLAREHGEVETEAFFSLLYCARQGLEEGEFRAVFSGNLSRLTRQEPQALQDAFSLIFRQMREFFHYRGTAVDFCHAAIERAVEKRFKLGEWKRTVVWHRLLADYFALTPVWQDGDRNRPNPRRAYELVYQCVKAKYYERYADEVASYDWIAAKLRCFGAYAAVEDCALAKDAYGVPESVALIYRLLDLSSHILARQDITVNKAQGNFRVDTNDPNYNERYIGVAEEALADAARREDDYAAYLRAHPREREFLTGERQLAEQLWARACAIDDPRVRRLLDEARAAREEVWLRAAFPCLPTPDEPLLFTLDTAPPFAPLSISMTPDGKACAVSSVGWIRVYDLENRLCLHTLRQGGVVARVSMDSGAEVALSFDLNNEAWLWDIRGEKVLHRRRAETFIIGDISANGKYALVGGDDTPRELWDMATMQTVCRFTNEEVNATIQEYRNTVSYRVYKAFVDAVFFFTDGNDNRVLRKTVLAGPDERDDKKLSIRIKGDGADTTRVIDAHNAQILIAVTSRGADIVATTSNDRTVGIWGLPDGEEVARLINITGNPLMAQMDEDATRLAVAVNDCTINLYDIENIRERKIDSSHHWMVVRKAFVSADGETAVTLGGDDACKVWSLRTGACLATRKHAMFLMDECFAGGRVTWNMSGVVQFFDPITGKSDSGLIRPAQGSLNAEGNPKMIRGVKLVRPDGDGLAAIDEDGALLRLDVPSGDILAEHPLGCDAPDDFRIHEGRALLAGKGPLSCSLWDLHSNARLAGWESGFKAEAVAVAKDLRAVYGAGKTLRELNAYTGEEIEYEGMHLMNVIAVAASDDGRWVATASYDKTLRLWSTKERRSVAVFGGHVSMTAVAFTPDSAMLVAGDESGRTGFFHIAQA